MKKNNKKGFVLAETIAVSVIIMTSLVIVYTQFATLNNSYKTSFQYNNVNNLYLVNNLRNFIKDDGLDRLIQLLDNNEYVDITSCPSYLFDEYLYCRLLVDNSNMKTILFTNEDISKLKNSIDSTNYSQTMKNYIKKINNSTGNSQRLIVEFEDETYATILFVFNEEDDFAMAPVSFDYTGSEQSFTAPRDGIYKIELWGASSFSGTGAGAYTSGEIKLNKDEKLYVYIGGQGVTTDSTTLGGYNGGGASTKANNGKSGSTGGGATDIRLVGGLWNNVIGLRSRIMVAGGGGSSIGINSEYVNVTLGNAGGLIGENGNYQSKYAAYIGKGGTQISGGSAPSRYPFDGITNGTPGSFGIGGTGGKSISGTANGGGCGGGGGYYGGSGASGLASGIFSSGGGSSYISGHTGCVAITSSTATTPKSGCTTGTTDNSCSIHYSDKVFNNTVMIDGGGFKWSNVKGNKVAMPNPTGGYYEIGTGNVGNGHAKITYVGQKI